MTETLNDLYEEKGECLYCYTGNESFHKSRGHERLIMDEEDVRAWLTQTLEAEREKLQEGHYLCSCEDCHARDITLATLNSLERRLLGEPCGCCGGHDCDCAEKFLGDTAED